MKNTPTQNAKTLAWVSPQERRRQITIVVLCCLASFVLGAGTAYVVWGRPHNAHVQKKEPLTAPQGEKKEFSPLDKKTLDDAVEKARADERYATTTRVRAEVVREFEELLSTGWKRELLIEDGKVLTIKNNRAAIGSEDPKFGFVPLDYDTYPTLSYRVAFSELKDKEKEKHGLIGKEFGYGVVGDLHHPAKPYVFPFVWVRKAAVLPKTIQALKLEESRLIVAIP